MQRRQRSWVWFQYAFLALGLCALGYCAKTFVQAWLYQRWAYQQIESPRTRSSDSAVISGSPPPKEISHRSSAGMAPIGQLEIPRVHISAIVAEGTSSPVLSRAVGHITGTALPGQTGNITLAAHRDTWFRHLGEVRKGDVITLKEPGRTYQYEVRFTAVVGPKDTWVLDRTTGETLTLLSCYPFRFVGPAPERFVVRARRVQPAGK
jgi:sortase A